MQRNKVILKQWQVDLVVEYILTACVSITLKLSLKDKNHIYQVQAILVRQIIIFTTQASGWPII